ncbi:A/G-specific adenine glycosylase [Ornithinicoccus hortensis]
MLPWYAEHARTLPWRDPDCSPWGVLVSEVMLQQTPVARVEQVWREWLRRWPTPPDLAAEPAGEAVRAWGRLGYPRRALRLHAAATAITERFDGQVPATPEELRSLPGVGEYTAAAVGAFAFGVRAVVLDTNVRRVLARACGGTGQGAPSLTAAERRLAEGVLPHDPATSATWNVAVMELGALVCTARNPRCADCPLAPVCRWALAGHPAYDGPVRAPQRWQGTDRQCRGLLVDRVRSGTGPVPAADLAPVWPDAAQRDRCLASLLEDGLLEQVPGGYAFPA